MRRLATLLALGLLAVSAPAQEAAFALDAYQRAASLALPQAWQVRDSARKTLRLAQAFGEVGDARTAGFLVDVAIVLHGVNRSLTVSELMAWHHAFPANDLIRNDLAWTILVSGGDPQAALALMRGNRRWEGASLDTLAYAQLRCGLPAEALQTMLDVFAMEERPGPLYFDHLGDILCANGFPDEALRAWGRARSLYRCFLEAGGDPGEALSEGYDDAQTRRKRTALKVLRGARPKPRPAAPPPWQGKLRQGKENA